MSAAGDPDNSTSGVPKGTVVDSVPASAAPWPVTSGPDVPDGSARGVPVSGESLPTRAQVRDARAHERALSAGGSARGLWLVLATLTLAGLVVYAVVTRQRSEAPVAQQTVPTVVTGVVGVTGGALGRPEDLAALAGVWVGDLGADRAPSVHLPQRAVQVGATVRRTLRDGQGQAAAVGSTLRVAGVTVRGSDGSVVENSYGDPQLVTLTPAATLPGLVGALAGVHPGERVLVAVPPGESFTGQGNPQLGISADEHLVFVFDVLDVLPDRAAGVPVAAVAGLPTVGGLDADGPQIRVPRAAAPRALVVQPLIEGTGPAVAPGQDVVVHYSGVLWKDGTVIDSSWRSRQPFLVADVGQADVIPAWNKALVGARVGSRLLLVVPPAEGYGAAGSPPAVSGTDTLVFVIDILAAYR